VGRAAATIDLPGRVSAAEALWYDHTRWPTFVDGLAHVDKVQGDWPRAGARLLWVSQPGGRGRVVEEVTEYEARVGQTVRLEDEHTHATQRVAFEPREDGSVVRLELEYRLKRPRPLMGLVDLLFIRRQQRDALQRTLRRFRTELAAESDASLAR
jgi:uncharacterized membrane protein